MDIANKGDRELIRITMLRGGEGREHGIASVHKSANMRINYPFGNSRVDDSAHEKNVLNITTARVRKRSILILVHI